MKRHYGVTLRNGRCIISHEDFMEVGTRERDKDIDDTREIANQPSMAVRAGNDDESKGEHCEWKGHDGEEKEATVFEVKGDIMLSETDYISPQCNCTSWTPMGIAKTIFKQIPEANTCSKRDPSRVGYNMRASNKDKPGTISIHGSIVNMHAQYKPG